MDDCRGVPTPFSNTLVSPKYSQVGYLGELFSPKYSTWERVDFETAKSSPKYSQVEFFSLPSSPKYLPSTVLGSDMILKNEKKHSGSLNLSNDQNLGRLRRF